MTTTLDLRRERHPPADRRADRHRLRHRPRGLPEPGRRRGAARDRPALADPGHRRHPLPAEVRLRRHRGRLRGGPRQPGQHPQVRRPGQGDRAGRARTTAPRSGSASTPAASTSGCSRSTARPPPRRSSRARCGRPSLFEEHDFHDFKISVKHNDPVVMVRAYELLAEAGDWPLHLGVTEAGPAFQGTIKSGGRLRGPAQPGHRRHHPRLAVRAAGRGGQGRPPDPGVAQPQAAPARDRLLPVLRARPGRRLQARRRGHRRSRRARGAAARRRDGLCRQRPGRGP